MRPEPSGGHHLAQRTTSPERGPLLHAQGLRRSFDAGPVLRGVDLTLAPGERVALLGANGSGKTTLIRVLATLLRPSAGSLTIGGVDALRDPARARPLLGLLGERTLLYGDLSPRENLRFYGRIYGVPRLEPAVEAALARLDTVQVADRPVRTLSRGMQQRVALARAILHDPLVLLLDEPETALDDAAQQRLSTLLAERAEGGRAALVVTHRLDWARTLDRAVFLRDGILVDEGAQARPLSFGGGRKEEPHTPSPLVGEGWGGG